MQISLFSLHDFKVKRCSKCGEIKHLKDFYKRTTSPDGKNSTCKQCDLQKVHQWYIAHSEQKREYVRKWYIDHIQEKREKVRSWSRAHPDKVKARVQLKARRKFLNGGHYEDDEWIALIEKYNHTCLRCGKKEPEIKLYPDHIIPVILGGTSNIDNIQPLCKRCNCIKHTKVINYRQSFEERKAREIAHA